MANYVPKDSAYRAARQAGYRSRAALKLVEITRKFRLLRPGMRVVDLGCWPGGWLQVASAAVGPSGVVVGVDLGLRSAVETISKAWEIPITISIGISSYPAHGTTVEELLPAVEKAAKFSKDNGKNQITAVGQNSKYQSPDRPYPPA